MSKKKDKRALAELRESERKPPKKVAGKRLIGFVNMATGEKRAAYPDFITLPAKRYDQLLALVRWVEATPACVELPDRAWERIDETMSGAVEVDEAQWPGVYVDSVQIETIETSQRNITPGTLVVLLSHEDAVEAGDDSEHHCVLVRGKEDGDDPSFRG